MTLGENLDYRGNANAVDNSEEHKLNSRDRDRRLGCVVGISIKHLTVGYVSMLDDANNIFIVALYLHF